MAFDDTKGLVSRFVGGFFVFALASAVYGALALLSAIARADDSLAEQWVAVGKLQAAKELEWFDSLIKRQEEDLLVVKRSNTFIPRQDPTFSSSGSNDARVRTFLCESPVAKQVYAAMLTRRIADLKVQRLRASHWIAPRMEELRVGQFGYMIDADVGMLPSTLLQDKAKLPKAEKLYTPLIERELMRRQATPEVVPVFQIIDKTSMLVKYQGRILKLEDISTDGLTDDSYYPLLQPMIVGGTTTYDAAIGTNTVFVLKPIPIELVKKWEAAVTAEDRHPFVARTWTDLSGKFTTEAMLADFDGKQVTLKTKEGRVINLPLTKLSRDDRKYVQEILGAIDGNRSASP